ncbi:hypothetical protein HDU84_005905, partial [Entophlyctis sp. JEL0112]
CLDVHQFSLSVQHPLDLHDGPRNDATVLRQYVAREFHQVRKLSVNRSRSVADICE